MSVITKNVDSVLIVTLDNPPVNALSAAVRQGLWSALDQIEEDSSIIAVVIAGGGKLFCGGADISEFGLSPVEPLLPDVLLRLSNVRVPIIAAVDGGALGGGCELALACHYRLVSDKASFALPEVNLGLIPGAGGTQRLPRIIGVQRAVEMIAQAKTMSASEAIECGLADKRADDDIVRQAIDFAKTQDRPVMEDLQPANPGADWLQMFEEKCRKRARGQMSPLKAIEAVKASIDFPLADGLKREREIFLECMQSDQRKGLVHAFKVERAVRKAPELEGAQPIDVKRVGLLGAGTMGAGIASALAASGYEVKIFDTNADALDQGVSRITKGFDRRVEKKRLTRAAADAAIARVTPISELEALHDADLVIEAVIERMDVKKDVFGKLSKIVKPHTVLASNTSYLDINEIARATSTPENVIGMHFFSPADVMRLLEIVKTDRASKTALATAMEVGRQMKKVCVLAGVCDGFIGNRIFKLYRQQAEYIVQEGAAPEDVDRVMREFGFAMGPFQVSDLAGLDIGWHNRRREDAMRDPDERYVDIADRLYELKRLGQKSGAGWYQYKGDGRTGEPDPVVADIIRESATAAGVEPREVSDEEILNRLIGVMINEGAAILADGIASRALDIDAVLLNGYGFPAYRGGPMFYADELGLGNVVAMLTSLERFDARFKPSELLVSLMREGRCLADV